MSSTSDLHIYISELNNRVYYIFRHVFGMIGLRPILTNDKEAFIDCTSPKINYSATRFSDELYIKPQGMLYEKGIKHVNVKASYYKGLPVLFSNTSESDLPFDIFAAIFYLITRYEEYLPFNPDKFDRFQPQESAAYAYKFIEEPIVEKWIELLKDLLQSKYIDIKFSKPSFKYIPTIDVDSAFAYRNKGLFLGTALFIRDIFKGDFSGLIKRIKVTFHLNPDPFDNFNFLLKSIKESGKQTTFFFLSGRRSKYDKNISLRKKAMKDIIKGVSEIADVGLHPSFESNRKITHLEHEKANLERALKAKVYKSRQHFIKINFPKTFLNLAKTGITEDYSVGYAASTGFRSGTCTPYNFYDLTREKEETDLKIFPFQIMDTTFKTYLNQTASEAEKKIIEYRDKVKRVNGTFIMIWHNDTFVASTEGEKWRQLFLKLLES